MNCLSNEAYRVQKETEEKSNRLEQRRNRLAAILEGEKLKFQVFFLIKTIKANFIC